MTKPEILRLAAMTCVGETNYYTATINHLGVILVDTDTGRKVAETSMTQQEWHSALQQTNTVKKWDGA